MDLQIKGVQRTSLIDYPGKVCSVVFVSRCNFRCPFCHNPELVFDEVEEDIDQKEVLDFLEQKKKWIDGVCITGGEPTLHKGLPEFIRKVKEKGLLVKLDTNGTNPSMISALIKENLLDYVAMDIKSSTGKYDLAAGTNVNKKEIQDTVGILMDSNIPYGFRTTVVPGLFDDEDAEEIGKWLKGAKKFCIQQFRNTEKVLDPQYQNIEHYHLDKLEKFKTIIKKYIDNVEIRGV